MAVPQAIAYPVAEASEESYAQFLSKRQPTDTREELALQRTFLLDLMKACRVSSELDVTSTTTAVLNSLQAVLLQMDVSQEHVDVIRKAWEPSLRQVVLDRVPREPNFKLVVAIQKMLGQIIADAEKMERMQKGRKLKVSLDMNMLSWVIREFVIRFVPKDMRAACIEKARSHGMHAVRDPDE